jgi:hypothetical protein
MVESSRQLTPDLIRRLAFVRYLYGLGIDQSHRPEPFATVALLTFHDACEMFLQIAAEYHGIRLQKQPNFLDYWALLAKVNIELSHNQAMSRLNRARGNLKHGGVLPAHTEIEGFRATVTEFLHENSITALGADFERFSLTQLIRSNEVRAALERAEAGLLENNLQLALGEATIAFVSSMREYQTRPTSAKWPDRGYDLRRTVADQLWFAFAGADMMGMGEMSKIKDALEKMSDVFSEAILVVGYNLDFDGYQLFKTHAPVAHQFASGKIQGLRGIEWVSLGSEGPRKLCIS